MTFGTSTASASPPVTTTAAAPSTFRSFQAPTSAFGTAQVPGSGPPASAIGLRVPAASVAPIETSTLFIFGQSQPPATTASAPVTFGSKLRHLPLVNVISLVSFTVPKRSPIRFRYHGFRDAIRKHCRCSYLPRFRVLSHAGPNFWNLRACSTGRHTPFSALWRVKLRSSELLLLPVLLPINRPC
ncbi:hypothetical protein BC832DRAFT_556466 [Gaertneriomyces semiglobifer]|nr:hypothetical protein BC832DRAFT_556466 [Gaertneriomyces semiglobifer]